MKQSFKIWMVSAFASLGGVAGITLLIINDYELYESPSPKASAINPMQGIIENTADISLQAVKTVSLFGTPTTEKAQDKPKPAPIPETRLNLELKGTFTNTNRQFASAIISESNKDSHRYFVGQKVPGNAELVAVHKDSVILRRNGRDEVLKFARLSRQTVVTASSKPVSSANRQDSTNLEKTDLSTNGSQKSTDNGRSSIESRLQKLRARNHN